MATSILFFTSKTEQSRVIAIQRPIVITQERKTPAYYVYQQTQKLEQKNQESKVLTSKYLSSLSLSAPELKIKVTEMKFNKREFGIQTVSSDFHFTDLTKANKEIKSLTYAQIFSSKQPTDGISIQDNPATTLPFSKKWATIRGKFELVGGVGIVDHYIELKRIEEGQVREIGFIDLKAGLYSIDIESPQGYLIAQIKDRAGRLIGEDREKLINLQSRGNFFEGPFIRVGQPETIAANPAFAGYGKTLAPSTSNNKMTESTATTQGISVTLFDNQNTLTKPNDVFTNISKYSTTISRIFDPSRIYKNITTIRQTGEKTETTMFTTKWVNGVIEYISDVQKIEFKSRNGPIIVGRVLSDGKPAIDVQVQIDSDPGLVPIYFDQFMIPSFTQNKTSENGFFMFVGIEPNNYQVVAIKQNIIIGSQMFIAEEEAMAFQNISGIKTPRNKIIRTFDAFTSTPVPSAVISTETADTVETISGTEEFKTLADSGVSEYLTRTNDRQYVSIRYVQNSRQEYVHIPMIQESWLAAVKNFKQITDKPNSGIIIGFSTDLDYDAYLASEEYNKKDIVYFNSLGQVSPAPVIGGGFILFNVPNGAHEIVLQERNSEKIYSQVFNVQAQEISVAHFVAD